MGFFSRIMRIKDWKVREIEIGSLKLIITTKWIGNVLEFLSLIVFLADLAIF